MGLSETELVELRQLGDILERGTYYELFRIQRVFNREDLRNSYYDLSRRWHPDRFYRREIGVNTLIVEEVFAGINFAYRTLDDPEERSRYDRELVLRGIVDKRVLPPDDPRPKVPDEPDPSTEEPASGEEAPPSKGRKGKKRPKKRPKKQISAPMAALKKQLVKRLRKAKTYYQSGLESLKNEQVLKAASSFYLAHQYDPRNEEYKKRYLETNGQARGVRAQQLISLARSAEDYGSFREAVSYYQKAVELDPPEGAAYYRLGRLLRRLDATDRAALDNLRVAVNKTGDMIEYRLQLAECFEDHGMKLNAHREYKSALEIDSGNEAAKTGLKRTR